MSGYQNKHKTKKYIIHDQPDKARHMTHKAQRLTEHSPIIENWCTKKKAYYVFIYVFNNLRHRYRLVFILKYLYISTTQVSKMIHELLLFVFCYFYF